MKRRSPAWDDALLRRWLRIPAGRTLGHFGWCIGIRQSKETTSRFIIIERRGMGMPIKWTVLYTQAKGPRREAFDEARAFWRAR